MTAATSSQLVELGWLNTAVHEGGGSRQCVHLIDRKPPNAFLVMKSAVGRLNYQTRVIAHHPPCIAGRIGDVLIIGFDYIGDLTRCQGLRRNKDKYRLTHRFDYRLTPIAGVSDKLLATRIKYPT